MVFRNDIKWYNTNPRLGGSWKDELDDVSRLHIEIKEEAAALPGGQSCHQVIY